MYLHNGIGSNRGRAGCLSERLTDVVPKRCSDTSGACTTLGANFLPCDWVCCPPCCPALQMAIVLSLESVEEFLDYWGDDTGHITWRLTPSEVKAILGQRADFNKDTISALPL